jgi:very-short-patch-repair endonuclease
MKNISPHSPGWFKTQSRRLRRESTDAERQLWATLRSRQLERCKFRRQVVLGSFIVDFCCFDRRLIVELDGGQHAARTEQDNRRTAELQRRGFRVLRVWDTDVFKNREGILRKIQEALNEEPPSPAPPHSGGSTSPTRSAGGEEISASDSDG